MAAEARAPGEGPRAVPPQARAPAGAAADGATAGWATAEGVTTEGTPAERAPAAWWRTFALLGGMAVMLLWPAIWNGYPIVFADTGTYLSQAIHRYLGWDRPAFYSLFMLPLHMMLTTWPVVVAQALLASWVLLLVWRVLAPGRPDWWLLPAVGVLCVGTWVPWLASELMPDLFTPLLVLVFCLLVLAPDRLSRWERVGLVGLAAFMIATQLSSVALWAGLLGVWWLGLVIAGRRWFAPTPPLPLREGDGGRGDPPPVGATIPLPPTSVRFAAQARKGRGGVVLTAILPLILAALALATLNLAGHGRFALSPHGNVFLLARLIADGPGKATLETHCPDANWRLCPFIADLSTDSDILLWSADSPIVKAGGHKAISAEAGAIIAATLRDHPAWVASTALRNSLVQLVRFHSGDGLEPWPTQVSPWIARDFPPREAQAYQAARQQTAGLSIPLGLGAVHVAVAIAGIGLSLVLLPRMVRRSPLHAGFLAIALLALPAGAVITGALSCPHDRYQARIAWLPALVGAITLLGWRRLPA